jgi:hypothetical protein
MLIRPARPGTGSPALLRVILSWLNVSIYKEQDGCQDQEKIITPAGMILADSWTLSHRIFDITGPERE